VLGIIWILLALVIDISFLPMIAPNTCTYDQEIYCQFLYSYNLFIISSLVCATTNVVLDLALSIMIIRKKDKI